MSLSDSPSSESSEAGNQARIRQLFSQRRRQAEKLGAKAGDQFERNLVGKIGRLYGVRRFVTVWLLLCIALIGSVIVQTRALSGYYQQQVAVPGGIYNEGIVGNYSNANPIYASGLVNDAVSKLLFAGLFTYDDRDHLTGDLAEGYSVDTAGTTYTVKLRSGLSWHDGRPLTSADVVFTYQAIQNPDTQSPLNVSWQNVTVAAPDSRTVTFKLSNPLSSFPYSLTNGIIPQHAFARDKPASFRSLSFNTTAPVGAGPYKYKTIEVSGNSPASRRQEIELVPFEAYHGGTPKIPSYIIHTYPNAEDMTDAFRANDIMAMAGLQEIPPDLEDDPAIQVSRLPLTAANMVFFKTTDGVLADKAVRQALVGGTNVASLTRGLRQPVIPVREPVLAGSQGYDPALQQLSFGPAEADRLLNAAGWLRQPDGIRAKDGRKLTFKLYVQNVPEYRHVSAGLHRQWQALGIDAQVFLQSDADLRATVFGVGGSGGHSYDALLYGISLGVDPDVFVYWHSSQADVRSASRLNLSEYRSPVADAALADGRTRNDPVLRTIKYKPFLAAWRDDAPALGLYQARFLYVTRGQVFNLPDHTLTSDTDRYDNVSQWMIRSEQRSTGK